jgi:SAM-dependent methyltransferase
MTREQAILEFGVWLRSPAGRYLLAWEQDRLDRAVTDAFGFHALQLGLPAIEGLRANRMPHRWVACDALVGCEPLDLPPPRDAQISIQPAPVALYCEFDALPFPQHSVDLVVLPHALELAADPHQLLREVERILVPEGRVVICGLNPASLWALRQRAGHVKRGVGIGRGRPSYLPSSGDFIGYWRLRDWLRLLGFHIESGRFGCYRPPLATDRWLERFDWMDPVGDRWWPVLGAAYFLVAVKRVRGMRLVGLLKNQRRRVKAAAVAVANRETVTKNETR